MNEGRSYRDGQIEKSGLKRRVLMSSQRPRHRHNACFAWQTVALPRSVETKAVVLVSGVEADVGHFALHLDRRPKGF